MMPLAWEIGGDIGRLSRAIQPFSSKARLFAMLELNSYIDESETENNVMSVALYWAAAHDWWTFEQLWKAELDWRHLGKEFHAVDCEQGVGIYKGRDDRLELWARFIDIVLQSRLRGVYAVIDLSALRPHAARLKELQAVHSVTGPYYLLFQLVLETMGNWMAGFPADEKVAVVFDNRPDPGQVSKVFNALHDITDPAFGGIVGRLGTCTPGESEDLVGLQAADILAYEAKRHYEAAWGITAASPRWQWQRLQQGPVHGRGFTATHIPALMGYLETQWSVEAEIRTAKLAAKRAARARASSASRARTSPSAPQSPELAPPVEPS